MIHSLDSTVARDLAISGGKGSALAALRAAGFPVPDAFIVTEDEGASSALGAHLRQLGDGAGPAVRFAVRSSGCAEDSTQASFAGQFETVLGIVGVEDVAAAITRCFASLSSDRLSAYRDRHGVRDTSGAVIVQRLIEASAAGVAFTLDPITGARDRILIDAAAGLGDAVVGGLVTPDGFVVAKTSGAIIERRLSGVQPCITDDVARAVAQLATNVEQFRDAPVDIEWAWANGCLYLLQARPITAIGNSNTELDAPPADWVPAMNTRIDPRFPVYSNGNVSEILPGCVTPLTFSMFSRGVERSFRDVAETVGSMPDVGSAPIVVGFFYHRVYLNASYFMTAADNSPGATRDTVYEDLIGPPPDIHPAWQWSDLLPWRLWRGLGMARRFLAMQGRLDADIAACHKQYDEDRADFARMAPSERTADDLANWIALNERGMQPAIVHIRASQFATSSFSTLKGLTKRWLGDESGALASTLVTGIGTLASTSPAASLHSLAQHVLCEPELSTLFLSERDDQRLLACLRGTQDVTLRDFYQAFAKFIDQFGHRGFREVEFQYPVWAEDPGAVIALVRTQLSPGALAPQDIAHRQQAVGEAARRDALAKLPSYKRGFFDAVLTSTRKHISAREEMKDLLLRFLLTMRHVIAEAKRRLSLTLAEPDDIYFLLDTEIANVLRGEWSTEMARACVEQRRREFSWCEAVSVPKVQEGAPRYLRESVAENSIGELIGVPVSPGVVEGHARVVLDPTNAMIERGEILVAPVTDVAWTPLFLHAAGLVVDVGGPLSHGSIVAREYGIPAITAVKGATLRIRTGDRIRVDGRNGLVTLLDT